MRFLSKHWYDLGGVLALLVGGYVLLHEETMTRYAMLMWISFMSLCLHQLEEYKVVGTFPGMVNRVMYQSTMPDRYPLNAKTAVIVNVVMGWGFYILAALLAEKAVWLGIATVLVSVGNTVGHTFLFNIKGKTLYNAGLASCWLLFVPISWLVFKTITSENLATTMDYVAGVGLGVVLNYVGILKMIDWMADADTPYVFPQRNLLAGDRKE